MLTTFLLNIERVDRSSENWEENGKVHCVKVALYATECIFCITKPPSTLASFIWLHLQQHYWRITSYEGSWVFWLGCGQVDQGLAKFLAGSWIFTLLKSVQTSHEVNPASILLGKGAEPEAVHHIHLVPRLILNGALLPLNACASIPLVHAAILQLHVWRHCNYYST